MLPPPPPLALPWLAIELADIEGPGVILLPLLVVVFEDAVLIGLLCRLSIMLVMLLIHAHVCFEGRVEQ